jgi:hypothetical protein
MTQQEFQDTLRKFIRREPFVAFVVEMTDGRLIEVPHPEVGIGGGIAGFFRGEGEFDLVEFQCEEVRSIRAATQEAAS